MALVGSAFLAGSAAGAEVPLSFVSGDGVRLAGTLTVPKSPGPHPAALLVGGFGPHDRDGRLQGDSYARWSEALTARGVAVLRYDKRGIADSEGGNLAWLDRTLLEADAAAAVRVLAARPEVDRSRVAIVGHSQGGDIALIAGTAVPSVRRVVTMAAPARPLSAYARTSLTALRALAGNRAAAAIASANPVRDAARLRAPLLIVHGTADNTVPVTDANLLRNARRSAGRPTLRAIVPGLGHQLLTPDERPPAGLVARIARFVRSGT